MFPIVKRETRENELQHKVRCANRRKSNLILKDNNQNERH